ncbi:ATP-binding cassette domain-containing protein [Roseomonas sp. E05]|uniref:ABC transporter ATP-binding protein n=1 Tax=Roseomonas sp. E05 TaxID=3046310 RepID=UPI0024B9031E|nr:oligopeptide/dipeptide ABC transporter ATP-binding protein [Roseomonas sp. E05]MDJ0388835.1 ATP-binding cassette domain-containing protein [Roseomonas sp. E05]
MSSAPLLELRDVRRRYSVGGGIFAPRRELTAVAGVSLTLGAGEALGLVGESGCGKSTLARLVLGLEVPSEGEVLVAGRPIAGLHRLERSRLVQPVFQDPYSSLNPRRSIAEIVAQPLAVHGIGTPAERRDQVAEMLALVGLAPRHAAALPAQLSGGQRQRVAIARALVLRPALVVCDEPTSALDVSVQAQILNLLLDLRDRLNLSYLFISHNLAVVQMLAGRVAVMYLGRMVEEGPARQVLTAPTHPYTRALLASVLTPDPALGLPAMRLGTAFPDPLNVPPGCAFNPRCPFAFDRCRAEPPALVLREGGTLAACHLAAEAPTAAL